MTKQITLFSLFLLTCNFLLAQIGGNNTFEFLNLNSSARVAALGGNAIATRTDDVTLVSANPSQLMPSMNKQLALSFVNYFAGIKYGDVAYANEIKKLGRFAANIHYASYGTFDLTDQAANVNGSFTASEYALGLSWSRPLDSSFFIGATLKGIYSHLETYTSTGIAADVAGTYFNRKHLWCITTVIRNVGSQLDQYREGSREKLPYEVQLGVSKQLVKAPLRFSIIGQHLEKWNITYQNPNASAIDPLTGESTQKKIKFSDKLFRHLIINTEILISKGFNLRVGYNFERRKELGIENRMGLSGLSGGFGIRINRFNMSYGYAKYHVAGGSNSFTVSTTLSKRSK